MKYVVVAIIVLYILFGCFIEDNYDKCLINQLKNGNIRSDGTCRKRSHRPKCYRCICNRDIPDE